MSTGALVAVSLSGLGVIGGMIALEWYRLHRLYALIADLRILDKTESQLQIRIKQYETSLQKHKALLEDLEQEVKTEYNARRKAEEQRDRAIQKLIDLKDPGGLAAALRDELQTLQTLSNPAENSPSPTTDSE